MSEFSHLPKLEIPHHLSIQRQKALKQIISLGIEQPSEPLIVLPRSGSLAILGLRELLTHRTFPEILEVPHMGAETSSRYFKNFLLQHPDEPTPEIGEYANDKDLKDYSDWLSQDLHIQQSINLLSQTFEPNSQVTPIDDTKCSGTTLQTLSAVAQLANVDVRPPIIIFPRNPNWIRETLTSQISPKSDPNSAVGIFLNELAKGQSDQIDAPESPPIFNFTNLPPIITHTANRVARSFNPQQLIDLNELVKQYGPNLNKLSTQFRQALLDDFGRHSSVLDKLLTVKA